MADETFEYYIPPGILRRNVTLYTQLDGETLSLHGKDETVQVPANGDRPAETRHIKAATQEQLKELYDNGAGDPLIHRRKRAEAPPALEKQALPKGS